MKISEISFKPIIGKCYKLAQMEKNDYSEMIVYVETGPRNAGKPNEQYRISTGQGAMDVDWIDTTMFQNCKEVVCPTNIKYVKK